MQTPIHIPNGEQKVTVELTLKEAIALSGFRFNQASSIAAVARRKLKREIDRAYSEHDGKVDYHALEM